MKKLFGMAAGLVFVASAAVADPVFGIWKTPSTDGVYYHIKMKQCGSKICGTYEKKFENGKEVTNPYKGKNAMYDMVNKGGGAYAGKAWRGSDDKTFKGKGKLNGDVFDMKGCVLGGLVCSSQTWTRVK